MSADDGFDAGPLPAHLLVDDFDLDHRPDVALINRGQKQVSILRGDAKTTHPAAGSPAGTFGGTRDTYALTFEPTLIRAADINRDGIPDIVVLHAAERSVVFLLSNAADKTHVVTPGFTVPGAGALAGLALADFNSDGIIDIALGGDEIRIYTGTGTIRGE